ncbi:hypothetical protein TanjilG_03816 [Lupinus angustifolius]|uniref:Bromodomain associated domain-containing protein n=1 Tax=Lupinus angustifolius TaxID=3871 RepID=A0A1J7FP70_LUPAN|nr:PREDICTED: uncharacterized protein LOC109340015 [Lupinus angustifolius]OIV89718.1 hypothetical protein TanjilG_03816 [Lupinus angustifolius]
MNPMQKSINTKANSKPPRRTRNKKKRDPGVDVQVAETPSDFSFTIAKTAVAQICQSVGYKRSEYNALESLTNVATKYLQSIARSAATYANDSNRTDTNLFDLINGIQDLCSIQGFSGGSVMHKSSLLSSGALKEIVDFVNTSNEVPFAKPIQHKNVSGNPNPEAAIDSGILTSASQEPKVQGFHIPRWLPDFPDKFLYKNCGKVLVKERKCGEKLWEHSLDVCSGNVEGNRDILQINEIDGKEEKDAKMELTKKRSIVKFKIGEKEEKQIKMGVNMLNGVFKGRKRVSWTNNIIDDSMSQVNKDAKSCLKRKTEDGFYEDFN